MKPKVGPGWFESAGWLFFWRVWERGWISFLFNSSNLSITDSLSLFYFYVSYLYSFQSFSFSEFIECQSPFASITSSLCQVGLALLLSNCAFRLGYFYCNIYLLHNNYKYGNDNMIKVCNQISHLIFLRSFKSLWVRPRSCPTILRYGSYTCEYFKISQHKL